jgi:DNA invertase Pin-like site-specific DNA recombinase
MTKFVSYLRVSTERQGHSGLGLEAQRQAVADFLSKGDNTHIGEFVEVESGRKKDRPELNKALHMAKVTGATLLVAKLDRLSRNVVFLAILRESKTPFICADMPSATNFTIGILAEVAQHEAKMISTRVKAALAIVKQQGVKLGCPNGAAAIRRSGSGNGGRDGGAARKRNADNFAQDLMSVIADVRAKGITSLNGIARELNEREILTARGGKWYPTTVANVMARCSKWFDQVQEAFAN